MKHARHKAIIGALLCSTAALILVDASTVAHAAATKTGAAPAALEEIIVTAQKRKEDIQNTPVSVTAFTAKDLAERHLNNISEIAESTPNLDFNPSAAISGSNSAASVFIRGIGQRDFTLVTDPGVGLYLDGVYLGSAVGGVLDLNDTERVEVLRGPQGTLFGMNTIGGAINIISKKPGDELGGDIQVKTGTDNRIDVLGSIDLPLSQIVSARASFATLHQGGYVKNLGGGGDLGNTNAEIGRVVVDVHPNNKFAALFSADVTRRRENAQAVRILAVDPNNFLTFGSFNSTIAPLLGVPAYGNQYLAGGPFVTYQGNNPNTPSNLDLYGLSATLSYDFGPMSVKSITAYRHLASTFGRDTDNSPYTIIETYDNLTQHQFSQEFQFTGQAMANKLNWIAGLYYFNEKGNDLNDVFIIPITIKSGGGVNNTSWAGYLHASYNITPKLQFSFGGRYTTNKKEFSPDQQVQYNQYSALFGGLGFTNGQLILPMETFSDTFHNFSGALGLDYHITSNLMTYVSFNQGFKSGGFNQRVFPPRAVPGSFAPEKVNAYEAGWKFSNDAHTLRLNGDVFYTQYKDIQVDIIDVVAPGLGNAAKGRVYGGELEATALPIPQLLLQFGAGYLDTKYTSFGANFDPSQGITSASRFVDSPRWSLSGSASYTLPVEKYGNLMFRLDWSYKTKVYSDAANHDLIAQGPLNLFNAGTTFTNSDDTWELSFEVKNLTNKTYLLTGEDELPGFGYAEGVYARPREWVLSAKRNF